jgi:Ca2+-binding RTX toxin-like protein
MATIIETTEAPFSNTTPYSLLPGDNFLGAVGSFGDQDTIALSLLAGETYEISLASIGITPFSSGNVFLTDGLNTLIPSFTITSLATTGYTTSFTAPSSGIFFFTVQGWAPTSEYSLSISGPSLPPPPAGPTSGNDSLTGTEGNDIIDLLAGDDWFEALAGNDSILAGDGADTVFGGTGKDTIFGNDGDDYIDGNENNDELYGNAGNDTVNGGGGNDMIWGEEGDDQVNAGTGNDSVYGGDGKDVLRGDGGADQLFGEAGNDVLDGGAGNDMLDGGANNDRLIGGGGLDTLTGGAGNDKLDGGAADDILIGGSGKDTMTGGSGSDVFVFDLGSGRDTITDFQNGFDTFDVTALSIMGITEFDDIGIFQVGANTRVAFDGFASDVLLLNTDAALLDASDFTFLNFPPIVVG